MSRIGLTGKISKSLREAQTQEEKKEILIKYQNESLVKRIVNFAYNPLLDYGMADYTPKHTGVLDGMGISKFLHILEDILAGKFDKQEAKFACDLALSYINQDEASIFIGILQKDLDWKLSNEIINEVFSDINTGYPLQTPMDWDLSIFKTFTMPVVAQKKYHGMRINVKVRGTEVTFTDKDGHPNTKFDEYKEQFSNLAQHGDTVYDGMALLVKDHQPVDSTEQEIMEANISDIKFVLWDAIRYDGFMDGKDNRIGYNWRANGLEHMMMLAIESNPNPCYSMPSNRVCNSLEEVLEFCNGNNCDAIVKNLSGTWRGGETNQELIFRK